jgi:hypothetical protein
MHWHHGSMRRWLSALVGGCLLAVEAMGACPVDPTAPAGTLLTVQMPDSAPRRLGATDLDGMPPTELKQRRTVAAAVDESKPAVDQGIRYGGVLLRDLIERTSPDVIAQRTQRWLMFEAVATDGYRALFSWGELFNSPLGEQVLVIATQDGRPLAATEGPLALRALGDLRPGPRHVRNLCGLIGKIL